MFGIPYHFLAVHFPLVLVLAALFCDFRGEHEAGYRLTLWAALGGALAVITGLLRSGGQLSQMPVHAGGGIGGTFLVVIVAMLRYSRRARGEETFQKVWLLLELLAAVAIVVAAITGHRAVLGS